VEDNQEIYDSIIQAYRLAERVLIPVMVCYDGFMLSHTAMPVIVEDQSVLDAFLPPFDPPVKLDPDRPMNFGLVTLPEPRFDLPGIADFGGYMEIRHGLQQDLSAAMAEVVKVDAEFNQVFGRGYSGVMKEYKTDGADLVILTMGTLASEARVAADLLGERGLRVGIASLRLYRPFPTDAIRRLAAGCDKIMIIDRALSYGNEGPLAGDTKAALYGQEKLPELSCLVAGLGGREVRAEMIADAAESVLSGEFRAPPRPQEMPWINLRPARTPVVP
ncbi:MAG: pyruvate ferredoxin oxidoreductase, partial [Planctomycetota bacterium]